MATHSEIIKARAEKIATLTTEVSSKIDTELLRSAAARMAKILGSQNYGNYVTMFTENTVPADTEYHALTDGQKKLFDLENAEAYYLLSILALALKQMRPKTVVEPTIQFGEGKKISSMADAMRLAEEYEEKAINIISAYYSINNDVVIVAV